MPLLILAFALTRRIMACPGERWIFFSSIDAPVSLISRIWQSMYFFSGHEPIIRDAASECGVRGYRGRSLETKTDPSLNGAAPFGEIRQIRRNYRCFLYPGKDWPPPDIPNPNPRASELATLWSKPAGES